MKLRFHCALGAMLVSAVLFAIFATSASVAALTDGSTARAANHGSTPAQVQRLAHSRTNDWSSQSC